MVVRLPSFGAGKEFEMSQVSEHTKEILRQLAPYAIIVGSAARSPRFNDIDMVVNARGMKLAKQLFPHWDSCYPGNVSTSYTSPPLETFMYWYGPSYDSLRRRKLARVSLFGVTFRAWPEETRKNQEKIA